MTDQTPSPGSPGRDPAVVVVSRRGHLGQIELTRPRVINALTAEMVAIITSTLEAWAVDDGVRTVVLTGAGVRGLCAGGDILSIYADARAGGHATERFWRDEYRLNAIIARFAKPFVAIQRGLVLGGGIGVSAHGSVRIVTGSSRLGMPETAIGFAPDVGGTFLLSRAPGQLGTHLALTAGSVGAADAVLLGLADHFIAEARIPEFLLELEHHDVGPVVTRFVSAAPEGALAEQRGWIDYAYGANSVEEICGRLAELDTDQSRAALASITTKSPTALVTTLASLRSAATLPDLETVLEQEFRVSLALLDEPDLAEGIRAQVIDKDRKPRWSPATLAGVDEQHVNRFFTGLGARELRLTRLEPDTER